MKRKCFNDCSPTFPPFCAMPSLQRLPHSLLLLSADPQHSLFITHLQKRRFSGGGSSNSGICVCSPSNNNCFNGSSSSGVLDVSGDLFICRAPSKSNCLCAVSYIFASLLFLLLLLFCHSFLLDSNASAYVS